MITAEGIVEELKLADPPAAPYWADLRWALDGDPPVIDPPSHVTRTDGAALFYAASVNGIFGDPETAKTWLAQVGVVQALAAGLRAACIDLDHNGQLETVTRLLLLGADPVALADPERFRYIEPEDGGHLIAAVLGLVTWAVQYVTVDSLGELLPLLGYETNSNDEITKALRRTCFPMSTAGACVVTVDHLSKGAKGGGFATGGIAKKRAHTGSYLSAEKVKDFAPGLVGMAQLTIEKDRKGKLRQTSPRGKHAGTFVLDSTDPERSTYRIEVDAVAGGQTRMAPAKRKIIEALEQAAGEPRTIKQLTDLIAERHGHGLARQTVSGHLAELLKDGLVDVLEEGGFTDKRWFQTPAPAP